MKKNIENLKLETKRLVIRPLQEEDYTGLMVLDMDPVVRSFFPEGPLDEAQVRKELDRYLREWATLGFGIFAILEKDSNHFIGRAGFAKLDSGIVEFGYLILKEYWGKGIATEAAQSILEWGLHNIPIDRIIGFAPSNHIASIRVLEKCGMKYFKSDTYQDIACVFYEKKTYISS